MAQTRDDGPGIDMLIDGTVHHFRLLDYTTLDALAFREATGTRLVDAFNEAIDLPEVAALLWLEERRAKPQLTFAEVAARLTFASILTDPPAKPAAAETEDATESPSG